MLKLANRPTAKNPAGPAAFRRLCVETNARLAVERAHHQPPSGGCVLKQLLFYGFVFLVFQPPSGGCVLKQLRSAWTRKTFIQPPSGGCVLKPTRRRSFQMRRRPAAFRRLCVETE